LAKSGRFDTICVHGDTPNASAIATAVRKALTEAGVETGPLLRP
ncbi:MAG TPA: LamB/YcsF family protein, partial [Candidatus Dormibacteraeota bacterium]|nr:LamB/YcsF family protein [Candidatus Dormibacteraeota bacterium]